MFSFQFYQKRGHLLGSWLYLYIKGPDYRKNGLRSTKRKGQPESVFLCFLHLQWINLFFSVSPLHGLSFLQNTTPQKEQKQTNKKPRNSTKTEHQPKKPKNKETKQIAHPKRGKMQRIGSRHVFCFVCVFGLLSFWFLVSFEGLAEQKKWQDLTFCYFSQLRFAICFLLLFAVGLWFHDKTTTKPQNNVGIIVGTLWVWDMDWAILCPIQFWKYAKRLQYAKHRQPINL